MLYLMAFLVAVPPSFKCPSPSATMPGYEWRQPILMVDGVIIPPSEEERLGGLEPEQIASIRIMCWDPGTDTFRENGMPVIRIQTKALIEATRAPLLRLVRAQEEFRTRHERSATELEALEPFGVDADLDIDFAKTESGWSASTPSGDVAYRCTANEASASTLGEDGEPRLDCGPTDGLALRSLRERFDGG